jgi:hypothetical protein
MRAFSHQEAWVLQDPFGRRWRASLGALTDPEATSDANPAARCLRELLFGAFDRADGEPARTFIEIFDRLTGERWSDIVRWGGPDAAYMLPERWERELQRALLEAAEVGCLRLQEVLPRPAHLDAGVEIEPRSPEPPIQEQTTWIAVRLVDRDGAAIARAQFRLELPNGVVREGRLDDQGRARVDGIDAGSCKVTFPEYDERDFA